MIFFNACSKDDNPDSVNSTPGTNEIFISGMAFNPADKTISVGTTFKWINKDNVTHTVTSGVPGTPSGVFD
jgi:plastocyanin